MNKQSVSWDAVVPNLLKEDPELLDAYLQEAFCQFERDDNPQVLLVALRNIAKAKGGIPKLASQTGYSKEHLYRALSKDGNPTISLLCEILKALGYTFFLKRVA